MPFGIVGRTDPGMRQVVGFGNRSTGRGTFGGEFGARHGPQGPIGRTCATAPRRGPLAKLLWADLLKGECVIRDGPVLICLLTRMSEERIRFVGSGTLLLTDGKEPSLLEFGSVRVLQPPGFG